MICQALPFEGHQARSCLTDSRSVRRGVAGQVEKVEIFEDDLRAFGINLLGLGWKPRWMLGDADSSPVEAM